MQVLPHNMDYVVFLCPDPGSDNQFQTLQLSSVVVSAFHDIDPGGLYAVVTQDVCQLGNILLQLIEGSCKKAAERRSKYFDTRVAVREIEKMFDELLEE